MTWRWREGSEAGLKRLGARQSRAMVAASRDFFAVFSVILDGGSEERVRTKTKSCGGVVATGWRISEGNRTAGAGSRSENDVPT
jgi:hypothetical protein